MMGAISRATPILIQSSQNDDDQKFWNAELIGKSVTIHFGKVGTSGHRGTREFSSIAAAEQFLAQRVRQKLEEGYKPLFSNK
jgi:predicted DNA-binding WGR domain protein